ncbi:hypothetical protein ACTE7C_003486, partial [Vibrio cholerae]
VASPLGGRYVLNEIYMKLFNGIDVISQINEIKTWLASYGLNALASRYGRYVDYIDSFYNVENPLTDEGKKNFDLMTLSQQELIEIASIKHAFGTEKSKGFVDRLQKIVKGSDHLVDREPCESRNYMYELLVAARLKNRGFIIDFDSETDVIAIGYGRVIFIECKRVTSIRGFESNFKKAGDQLKRERAITKYPQFMIRGFIFIDVLPYISEHIPKFEVDNHLQARALSTKIINDFKEETKRHINRYIERYASVSLGVCITATIPIWLSDLTLLRVDEMAVVLPVNIDDRDAQEASLILNSFINSLDPGV